LGMAAAGITYDSFAELQILLGTAGDTFAVESTHAGTVTTVDGGAGGDTVNVGNLGHTLNGIDDLLIVKGGGNAGDTLNLDDTGEDGKSAVKGKGFDLAGLGLRDGGVDYSGFKTLNIDMGTGRDRLTIESTVQEATVLG